MDVRMNGVMNGIVSDDGEYQQISRKSDEYSGRLAKMELPKEVRLLIDRYVSEQNALGSRYGMSAPIPPVIITAIMANAFPSKNFRKNCLSSE